MQQDFYRPVSYHQLSASLTAQGLPVSWMHAVATLDTDQDGHQSQSATDRGSLPYSIATTQSSAAPSGPLAVPAGIWRSSNYFNTIFAVESFLDEVAAAGGLDPYHLRLHLLSSNPSGLSGSCSLQQAKPGGVLPYLLVGVEEWLSVITSPKPLSRRSLKFLLRPIIQCAFTGSSVQSIVDW